MWVIEPAFLSDEISCVNMNFQPNDSLWVLWALLFEMFVHLFPGVLNI